LTADHIEISSEFPRSGDVVLSAKLETIVGNTGQVIAGYNGDVAVCIGKGVERRSQSQRVFEGGIDVGIVCVDVPAILSIGRVGFDAPPQRVAGVLKELMPWDRAGDGDDVVGVERVKPAQRPM
jgi:hypothetical protein